MSLRKKTEVENILKQIFEIHFLCNSQIQPCLIFDLQFFLDSTFLIGSSMSVLEKKERQAQIQFGLSIIDSKDTENLRLY